MLHRGRFNAMVLGMAQTLITVFGGSGFIGRHLIQRLARSGARVRVVTRRPERALFLKPLGDVGQIVTVAINLSDPRSIKNALAGSDGVVNLIGIMQERGRRRFAELHVALPERIARAAAEAGVKRLIHVSAIGANAEAPSAYGRSKAAGEVAARAAFPALTIIRPSLVFGPEDKLFNLLGAVSRILPVLPLFYSGWPKLRFDGIFAYPTFPPAGDNLLQPVYVGDVGDAIGAALNDPASPGRIYELGGPSVYRFRELIALALEMAGRRACLVPAPYWALEGAAFFAQFMPFSPLNPDLVRLMKSDTVVAEGAPGLAELGVTPTALELILPTYMQAYRPGRSTPAPGHGGGKPT